MSESFFNRCVVQTTSSNELLINNCTMAESTLQMQSCKYVELSRNRFFDPCADAVTLTGDSVVCCEYNEFQGIRQNYAAIALKEYSGANLQKNLIQNCLGIAVFIQVATCGVRMEHNIIANCAEAINCKQGGEIFARHNAMTDCPRGFVAGGMLRGFFKNNHMTCEQKICANDIPPSFVVDSNCDTT